MELTNILFALIIGITSTYGVHTVIEYFYKNVFKDLSIEQQYFLSTFNTFICVIWVAISYWYFVIILTT